MKFIIKCSKEVFRPEEIAILEKHGHGYCHLTIGRQLPETIDEKSFLDVINGIRGPQTPGEIVWTKYLDQLKLEGHITDSLEELSLDVFSAPEVPKAVTGEDKKNIDMLSVEAKTRTVSPPLNELSKLRTKLTEGEEKVLQLFLDKLDLDWEIYIQPHLNGNRPDFVLLKPSVGIAVFEVKDWNLYKSFYHDGRYEYISPLAQIKIYRDEICTLYLPSIESRNAYACITAGIIFTKSNSADTFKFCSTLKGFDPFSIYRKYEPISSKEELDNQDINKIFPENRRSYSSYMNNDVAKDFRNWLHEPDFSAEQRLTPKLDERQRIVAETRTPSGYRRVKGPAGSGKSIVLAARAANLRDAGKKVLVITFNITLLHFLRELYLRFKRFEGNRNLSPALYNFHYWCKRVCISADRMDEYISIMCDDSTEVNNEEPLYAPDPTGEKLEKLTSLTEKCLIEQKNRIKKYDAILVDEGQDLNPRWWNLLRMVLDEKGEMLLVSDTTQDIYKKGKLWTDQEMLNCGFSGPWTVLKGSYRIPSMLRPYLIQFARNYLPSDTRIEPEEPDNQEFLEGLQPKVELRWVQVNKKNQVEASLDEIFNLLKKPKEKPLVVADITFLSSEREICVPVLNDLIKKKYKVTHIFHDEKRYERHKKIRFYRRAARVKVTTLHSFKGMENIAIVICIPSHCDPSLVYTGFSRLKQSEVEGNSSYLTVICSDPCYKDFGRSWPEFEEI
jgi:hypothetical protein